MGRDLKSKKWIVAKGMLFLFLAILSGILNLVADGNLTTRALLLCICVWASCRFYYFVFHVLHAYVDPTLPSAGLLDLLKYLAKRQRSK
jgi:hypothetical protein